VPFDGDTGVVSDSLFQTRQTVKQRALARIWITNDRDAGVFAPGYGYFIGGNTYF
jgi:hypothetical protein